MSTVSLALVGAGRWGQTLMRSVKGHGDKARFVAAVIRNPAKYPELAAQADFRVLPDLAAALADPGIEGIVLATPHSLHAAAIADCRAAGRPVLVEKPFTLDRASAESALAAGDSLVAAAHNRRFLPAAQAILSAVAEGRLGQLLHMEANFSSNVVGRYTADTWRTDDSESPAGGLSGMGIHLIDLMVALAGPMASVRAISSRRVEGLPIDDTMTATFGLASGASAVLTSLTASIPVFRLQVYGTRGAATLQGPDRAVFEMVDGHRETLDFPHRDIERAEIEAFADAIRGRAVYPVPLSEVLNGVSAFDAIVRSIAAGTVESIAV